MSEKLTKGKLVKFIDGKLEMVEDILKVSTKIKSPVAMDIYAKEKQAYTQLKEILEEYSTQKETIN